MGYVLGFGLVTVISIFVGLVVGIVGLFLKDIITFDSIAIAILSGALLGGLLKWHFGICIVTAFVIFFLLMFLQNTKIGFWVIASIMSLFWGLVFGLLFYSGKLGMIWNYGMWVVGFVLVMILHLRAKKLTSGTKNETEVSYQNQ